MLERVAILLVLAASASACAADSAETVFDPCSPLTVYVDPDASDAEVASVDAAVADWTRVLPTRITVERGPVPPGGLGLAFQSGDTFYRAIYWQRLAVIDVSRDRLDPGDYHLAIAHELGHSFGLHHVPHDERPSVMNVGNLDVTPTEDDASAVRVLWATCH